MKDRYYGLGKSAIFVLNHMPEGEDAMVVSELNALLTKMGCGSVEVKENVDPSDNGYYPLMTIRLNAEAAAGYNRRDAGRKEKFISDKNGRLYKVGKIKEMLETRAANEVAGELGISRSTLFRRLRDRDDDEYL